MMKKLLLVLAAFFMVKVNAQQLELVEDINIEGSSVFQFGSDPKDFTVFNNKLYFSAKGTQTGRELFSYDGTSAELVADINPSVSGLNFANSNPYHLTVFDSKLYFVATQANDSAYLYSTDGISAPTVVHDLQITSGASWTMRMVNFNNKILYTRYDAANSSYDLWEYDGTNAPSIVFSSSTSGSYAYKSFVELDGKLYFYKAGPGSSSAFYVYDGTNTPTFAPNMNNFLIQANDLIVYDNKIYFVLYDNPGTYGYELYSYDGINIPVLISDINSGSASSGVSYLEIFNNKLYFRANDGTHGPEVWSYDGTSVLQTPSINSTGGSDPYYLTISNNKLYYTATDGATGYELYVYDGTNTATLTEEVVAGAAGGEIQGIVSFQNDVYLSADNGTVARELFKYDGTSISLAANIFEGSNGGNPWYMTEYKNKIYFSAFAKSDIGVELYSYDGISTELVADIDTAHLAQFGAGSSSQPRNLIVFDDLLYFRATDGTSYKYWKYDGLNTPIAEPILPAGATDLIVFNSKLYYLIYDATNGKELWVYDGTSVSLVSDIFPGTSSAFNYAPNLTVYNNKLIFNANDGVNGYEMWQYDGTNTPTMIADINTGTGSSSPVAFKEYDGKLYFAASADTIVGYELWMYDGVNAPSLEVDVLPGIASNGYAYNSYPSGLNIVNDKLVFYASDINGKKDLWEYDFINTPVKLTDYNPLNSAQYQFASITSIDDALYFWADEGTGYGFELYKYNGTGSPVMFDELNTASGTAGNSMPQTPQSFLKYDGDIYLAANDGLNGYVWGSELYKIAACNIDETVTQNDAQLTANETGATYQWVDCNNNNTPIAGETNQTFTATISGDYACVIEKDGCETTTACKNVIVSGIESVDLKNKILIYPNPSSNLLNIKTDLEVYNIKIYNVIGKKVQQETTTSFSIRTLNQGIYFVEVITAEGTMNSQIVKK